MQPGPCQRLRHIASAKGRHTAPRRQLRTMLPLLAHAAGLVAKVGQHVGAHQRPAVSGSSRRRWELTEIALAALGLPVSTCRATCQSPSTGRLERHQWAAGCTAANVLLVAEAGQPAQLQIFCAGLVAAGHAQGVDLSGPLGQV